MSERRKCDCCLLSDYEGATDPSWHGYLCVICQPCPRCGKYGTNCGDWYCEFVATTSRAEPQGAEK